MRAVRSVVRREVLIELRVVRSLFGDIEVFDRVGGCKRLLGEMIGI